MKPVHPEVFLVSRPAFDWAEIRRFLKDVGGSAWADRVESADPPAGEALIEAMGRMCYRSWVPGLNPNVTRVRESSSDYLLNILRSGHGSVLEHANYSFIFHNVSRVFTHELVRHRAGTAVSQESLRFVRLEGLPFEHADFVANDETLLRAANELLSAVENFQIAAASATGIDSDSVDFAAKKVITSAARRYVPDGVATTIGWSANVRSLRHVIESRTDPHAEDEIRRVFDQVARIMQQELPSLFCDFVRQPDGAWIAEHHKV